MFKFLKIITILIVLSVSSLFLLSISILWKYSPELPSYNKIFEYKPELSSRLYTSDGVLLKSYHREERIFVPIERIPKKLINAFLSSEDKKFYYHFGIDFIAILRASISNIISISNIVKKISFVSFIPDVFKLFYFLLFSIFASFENNRIFLKVKKI